MTEVSKHVLKSGYATRLQPGSLHAQKTYPREGMARNAHSQHDQKSSFPPTTRDTSLPCNLTQMLAFDSALHPHLVSCYSPYHNGLTVSQSRKPAIGHNPSTLDEAPPSHESPPPALQPEPAERHHAPGVGKIAAEPRAMP
jgi:hypothetical protein